MAEENQVREQWKEYDAWGERILELKQQGVGSEQMLQNLALRVRALENEIGILEDSSIVKEYITK